MGSAKFDARTLKDSEPVPGYKLIERIGAGGYGEVWRAEAPGGLFKAIKFVYGSLDDVLASRELKSLNRVKEAHHPFLLSLERIEVIDGQLIIVTELADGSLKDRFLLRLREGMTGIPREELLGYLRDAADALDYLFEHHSLAHLDVKPENLLLVGNHVKVADFGLLKDLHETNASLMGGMTPLYAPPEVFDGRPGRNSDQYSLAIVYQEMLTGEPPFAGRSAAQLAAQHLNSPPMLSPLPPADRPTIGRALCKDSSKRFPSCRALIEALISPRKSSGTGARTPPRRQTNQAELGVEKTEVLGEEPVPKSKTPIDQTRVLQTIAAHVESLPALRLTEQDLAYRPTIFLGVGGMAGKTLARLRARLERRFGSIDQVPALQMRLVDTDVRTLSALTHGTAGTTLLDRETIAIPLRSPKDYRNDSKRLLEWMSRRWLYNIPRSLQTEGIRPLGRLAFVDHFDAVLRQLENVIAHAMDAGAIAASREKFGGPLQAAAPKVFLIASISGGTGSGIVLDLAYAVRMVLRQLGFGDDHLHGILIHATNRKAADRDLAISNSYAFLNELQHFTAIGEGYPGDIACGLPCFEPSEPPFRHAYIVHAGDELADQEFDAATDYVAEYLYQNSATPAVAFFDRARDLEIESCDLPLSERKVRTLGLSHVGTVSGGHQAAEADVLCRLLVDGWRAGVPQPPVEDGAPPRPSPLQLIDEVSGEFADALDLKLDSLIDGAQRLLDAEMRAAPDAFFRDTWHEVWHLHAQQPGRRSFNPDRLLDAIDAVLGLPDSQKDLNHRLESFQTVLNTQMYDQAKRKSAALAKWTRELVDARNVRALGARRGLQWFTDHLTLLEKRLVVGLQKLRAEAIASRQELLAEFVRTEVTGPEPFVSRIIGYGQTVLREVAFHGVRKFAKAIREEIGQSLAIVLQVEAELDQLAAEFSVAQDGHAVRDEQRWSEFDSATLTRVLPIFHRLDQELQSRFFTSERSFHRALLEGARLRDTVVGALRSAAKSVLSREKKDEQFAELFSRTRERATLEPVSLRDCTERATPNLLRCGGAKRLLMVVPDGANQKHLKESVERRTNDEATVVMNPDEGVILCYEVEQIPLVNVAAALIGNRYDYTEIAARLHTRIDVGWTSL